MLVAKTYYVGLSRDAVNGVLGGLVKRLDNLTGAWQNVSLPLSLPGANVSLLDVETDPNNGNKVFTVGQASYINGYFGIYVSSNGGVNWQIPSGNYQTVIGLNAVSWTEVSVVDSNTIYVSGTGGYICKSTDGGLSFNLCTNAPQLPSSYGVNPTTQDCLSIHFITPLAGVVGMENNFIMTSDGGVTWAPCAGGAGIENSSPGVPNPGKIRGIHVDVTSQIVVCTGENTVARTTNAGVSFTTPYTWANSNGVHLTWETDLRLWATGRNAERVRSIDGGVTWTVLSPYSGAGASNLAAHFYLLDDGFVSANGTILSTTDGGSTGLVSDTQANIITAVWTNYSNINCYLLTDCDGEIPPFIVSNDLSAVVGGTVQLCSDRNGGSLPNGDPETGREPLGSIFSASTSDNQIRCKCFTVSEVNSCNGAITVVISASFPDCLSCNYCYLLTDCTNPNNAIVTGDNLSQYVGQVIKLEDCPDKCWYVTRSHECPDPVCVAPVIATFETCADCLPPPVVIPVPELNLRRIKPGYYTPGCDPEYTETVSCMFAQAVYDKMIIDRYGVHMCCNEDVDKWDIKKQLLDLRALFDPTMCKSTLNSCCPPCDVVAIVQAFDPRPCPSPVITGIDLIVPGDCPAPSDNSVRSTIIIPSMANTK